MHPSRSFLAALASVCLAAVAHAQGLPNADTTRTLVAASGSARMTFSPDRATLTLLIEPQAMSVEEAGVRLASVERSVMDTLRRFNLPAGAIQLFNGGVTPYRSNMNPAAGPSFAGRTSVRVELNRLDMIPAITGAALAKGASFVSPPVFTLAAADSVRRSLVPRAFEQARREAQALASAAGGSLGRLLDLSESAVPINFAEQQQAVFLNTMMYDGGQRAIPNAVLTVTVSTRWTLAGVAR